MESEMKAELQKASVEPTPLLLQAVSKVEHVVARLQELQSCIAGPHLLTTSIFNSPSCRMPDLLGYSPNKSKSAAMECRVSGEFQGSFMKLGQLKGSSSNPEPRKSLTLADGWRHWSSPAKDVHDVMSEILLANKLTKQFANHNRQFDSVHASKAVLKPGGKMLLETKPNHDSTRNSVISTSSSGDGSLSGLEPTVCSSIESLSTPRPSSRPVPLNRRSSAKKISRKTPPHLFKVVVRNEGPAAKTGTAVSLRSLEARKAEARKLVTPSPLYKRRSGTHVQKPPRASGEIRASNTSQNSIIRGSVERKRLTNSASLRRSTEKFVEAIRALMEEEEQLKRANGQGKAVHWSKSPPVAIRPLEFDPPSTVKVKPAGKTHKNWLTNRFSKTATKDVPLVKPKKKPASSSKDLAILISRLPSQKMESPAGPASVSDTANGTNSISRTSSMGEPTPMPSSLPLPPARQAANVLKNSSRGMALKASRDKKSGYTSYALEPTVVLSTSREGLVAVDSNSFREKEKNRCSVGCPTKDVNASSNSRRNDNIATPTENTIPSYMRARAGAPGPGKENNPKSSNMSRRSSVGIDPKSATGKHSSGTSLLHRAKGWVSLHKTKDNGATKVPESSNRTALTS